MSRHAGARALQRTVKAFPVRAAQGGDPRGIGAMTQRTHYIVANVSGKQSQTKGTLATKAALHPSPLSRER